MKVNITSDTKQIQRIIKYKYYLIFLTCGIKKAKQNKNHRHGIN